ncbi:MAG: biotin/lipoyl-binding protein [Oscillospiraceae bacterium]|nr:biotin/lipoyl-binding protein [Oscillospiraceae bacterium]
MFKGYIKVLLAVMLFVNMLPYLYFSELKNTKATRLSGVEYQKKLEVTGTIVSQESIPVMLSYPVYIDECFIDENSYVNKGQLLFTIDTEKMQNYVKNNYFTLAENKNFDINKDTLINISTEIYASDSGTVGELTAGSGSAVMANEALCVIKKGDALMLKITLNQENYSDISVGDKIVFSPSIAPSRKYTGTVTDKTAVVRKETSLTGTKTVIDIFADIDSVDDFITDGLIFSGTVTKPDKKIIYTLPYEFIHQDENGEYVNVYDNGNIIKKYIETGIETENYAEIKTTFSPETIFVKDNYKRKSLLEYNNKQRK